MLKGEAERRELCIRSRMTLDEPNAVLTMLEKDDKIIIVPKRRENSHYGRYERMII
jgi:hypothetical protein